MVRRWLNVPHCSVVFFPLISHSSPEGHPNMGAPNGVPLDLRRLQGMNLVAGLVGEPKETGDFTRNLVSLTVSHAKVEVDSTKPLPSVVEFERESGEIIEVCVHYPWVPLTCSHCKELGHIVRNCLLYTPPLPPSKKNPLPASTNKTPPTVPSSTNKIPPKPSNCSFLHKQNPSNCSFLHKFSPLNYCSYPHLSNHTI